MQLTEGRKGEIFLHMLSFAIYINKVSLKYAKK